MKKVFATIRAAIGRASRLDPLLLAIGVIIACGILVYSGNIVWLLPALVLEILLVRICRHIGGQHSREIEADEDPRLKLLADKPQPQMPKESNMANVSNTRNRNRSGEDAWWVWLTITALSSIFMIFILYQVFNKDLVLNPVLFPGESISPTPTFWAFMAWFGYMFGQDILSRGKPSGRAPFIADLIVSLPVPIYLGVVGISCVQGYIQLTGYTLDVFGMGVVVCARDLIWVLWWRQKQAISTQLAGSPAAPAGIPVNSGLATNPPQTDGAPAIEIRRRQVQDVYVHLPDVHHYPEDPQDDMIRVRGTMTEIPDRGDGS